MTHPAITIADAVAAEITSATLSASVSVSRRYVPRFEPAELNTNQVCVVPTSLTDSLLDRASRRQQIQIDVAVLRRVDAKTDTAADPIINLAGEIAELFAFRLFDWGRHIETQHFLFSVEDLERHSTAKTILRLTFATRAARP
jgi:hypothetical protein